MTGSMRRVGWAAVLALMACSGTCPGADDRPNMVQIVADDLGRANLGCCGSRFHRTPHLDKLAAGGRRFAQAYSADPVCIADDDTGTPPSDLASSRRWARTMPGLAVGEVKLVPVPVPLDEPEKIAHGLLATGNETYLLDGSGKLLWSYPGGSRDAWLLENGHILIAVNKGNDHPGGAAVEVDRDGKVVFTFEGSQAEVNTVQPLENGRILLTEAGEKPRLLEVDHLGKIQVDVPLRAQTRDVHRQTRMARKLPNGNYLVPQLIDKVVREYTPEGQVAWEAKAPNWPFTAIRLDDGNTLVGCTVGDLVVEFDPKGNIAWQVTNDDLPGRPISDACGVQRLPNGNTVIASYRAGGDAVKLTEVTRDKAIVWTHRDPKRPGIHHFQILEADGKLPPGRPLR